MKFEKVYSEKLQQLNSNKIPSPRLDLDLIFCEILKIERYQLVLQDDITLNSELYEKICSMVDRRSTGEPLAYIFGYKHFYKSAFFVNKDVLVPRPETELIVEKSIELYDGDREIDILDMGCGSGCVGLSILKEWNRSSLVAIDICEKAIKVAKRNYQLLGLKNKFSIHNFDIKELSLDKYKASFDLIVANPPYIDEAKGFVQESVKKFEPQKALFSRENGFEDIRTWTEKASSWLRPKGYFIMEFGDKQCQEIEKFFNNKQIFMEYSIYKDYSDLPRFVLAQKK